MMESIRIKIGYTTYNKIRNKVRQEEPGNMAYGTEIYDNIFSPLREQINTNICDPIEDQIIQDMEQPYKNDGERIES